MTVFETLTLHFLQPPATFQDSRQKCSEITQVLCLRKTKGQLQATVPLPSTLSPPHVIQYFHESLEELVRQYRMKCQQFTYNAPLYISFTQNSVIFRISQYSSEICIYIMSSCLKLNPGRTKVGLVGKGKHWDKYASSINFPITVGTCSRTVKLVCKHDTLSALFSYQITRLTKMSVTGRKIVSHPFRHRPGFRSTGVANTHDFIVSLVTYGFILMLQLPQLYYYGRISAFF